MRLQSIFLITLLSLLLPPALFATRPTYNEANVEKLDGTIMVQHADGSKPTALQTGSTVEKGDIINVYDQSWVIIKTHKGDRIGIKGGSVVAIDEYYIEGPDRQIRLLLQKGDLLLRTNGCGSRQSFFEVNTGNVVTSVNEVQATLGYLPAKNHLNVQYFNGKMTVIDKDIEQKFKTEYSEHNWENGKMTEEEPLPVDEMDKVNFDRFFNAEDLLQQIGNNFLLADNLLGDVLRGSEGGSSDLKQARDLYHEGWRSYNAGQFKSAKDLWKASLAVKPDYQNAQSSLRKLSEEHPELKIEESDWKYESQAQKKP